MMKAMLLEQPSPVAENPLRLVDLPPPEIGPHEVLVKVEACGICHTDLHTVEGELPLPKIPLIPGHQVVGVVERVGQEVRRYAGGERVGLPWLHSTCGRCEFCRSGRENLCQDARFTGLHVDGGYSQYATALEDFAFPVAECLPSENVAPLLCGGVIGYRALRLSGVRPGGRLALWGFGASAHMVIQIALYWGCQVLVFTRSEGHRQLAEELGASWVGGPKDIPPTKAHSAIIFAPVGDLVLDALGSLEKGGVVALAGIYMTPIPEMDYMEFLYYERTIRSVTASTRRDVEELLEIGSAIPIRTTVQTFPLEEANQALSHLKKSEIDGSGVLLPD